MTENLPAVWTPSPFEGQDLLPLAVKQHQGALLGRENVDSEDLVIPSLKLLQGSSEEVKQGLDGARAGHFWLTGLGEPFAPPLRVLAVAHTKSRRLSPQDDRPEHTGLETCMSRDAIQGDRYGFCKSCQHAEWGPNKRAPACTESHNFTVLTPFGPAILRAQRTSIRSAKQLLTTWMGTQDNLWDHPIIITTTTRTDELPNGKKTTTHVMEMRWAVREDIGPALKRAALSLYEQVSNAHAAGKIKAGDEFDD